MWRVDLYATQYPSVVRPSRAIDAAVLVRVVSSAVISQYDADVLVAVDGVRLNIRVSYVI